MESRVSKYYTDDLVCETDSRTVSRSDRNARLYREVYGKYNDLDNLPLDDNTDEIDMEKLRELVLNHNKKEEKEIKENLNILEQRKRRIDEQRIYDINKILEKAKYENSKLKNSIRSNEVKPDTSRLTLLESTELSLEEIKNASKEYIQEENNYISPSVDDDRKIKEEKLSMTRELKYQNLLLTPEEDSVPKVENLSTKELSLDLFEDLKPTGNTFVTRPVKSESVEIKQIDGNIKSTDTRDIDIIKNKENTSENDFFTNSYNFSKNDFADDDFFDEPKSSGILKIILLMLAIVVFIGVIIYFIGTYGLGI